jgi:hypothetical protein
VAPRQRIRFGSAGMSLTLLRFIAVLLTGVAMASG